MKRQSIRIELWLNGELKARYQGRYVGVRECGMKPIEAPKTAPRKEVRKDHNAGARSEPIRLNPEDIDARLAELEAAADAVSRGH